jgi:hypothetical protein
MVFRPFKRPLGSINLCFRMVFTLAMIRANLVTAAGQSPSLNSAESYVLKQAEAGKLAHFEDSEDPDARTIRADFLGRLLMGKRGIVTHEGVRVEGAVIKGRLEMAGAPVAFAVWFNRCEFLSDVDFSHAQLQGDLSLMRSHFDGDLDLDSLKAVGNVVLDLATIEGDFDISGSQIGGNLELSGATFGPEGGSIQLNNLAVAKRADLDHITLNAPLILDGFESQILVLGSSTGELPIAEIPAHQGRYVARTINLSHATIHRELLVTGLQIENFIGGGLKVEGHAALGNLKVTKIADLSHAQLFNLTLMDDLVWPAREEGVQLAGIWFQYISPETQGGSTAEAPADGEAKWERLSEWVDHASFVSAPYQQLEDTLKREGRVDQANEIFERREKKAWSLGGLSLQGKIKNFLLHWLIGYGREPQWAFYWSVPVILFGWFVFRSRHFVQAKEDENDKRPYDPLWYSIDLFLPLSTLQAADIWIPKQDSRFRRYYARVHSILGWILIPIGLAAVTGIISGK